MCAGNHKNQWSDTWGVWFLRNHKIHPNYAVRFHRFPSREAAEEFIAGDYFLKNQTLVTEQEFRAEVNRRKEVVKTLLVYMAP